MSVEKKESGRVKIRLLPKGAVIAILIKHGIHGIGSNLEEKCDHAAGEIVAYFDDITGGAVTRFERAPASPAGSRRPS